MTRRGRWQVCGHSPEAREALRELGESLASNAREVNGPVDFQGERAWIKGAALRGSGARRHGVAHLLWRRNVPRIAEYHNLAWLRDHGFQAAQPLAAAVCWRGLAPTYQALVTVEVRGALPFEQQLRAEPESVRPLLTELAGEVARMHSLRFVHHDLFFRNLLVTPSDSAGRIVFLDAWAGGRFRSLRGTTYDLACLVSDCVPVLTPDQLAFLVDAYIDARRELGRPVRRTHLIEKIDRERRKLGDRAQDLVSLI